MTTVAWRGEWLAADSRSVGGSGISKAIKIRRIGNLTIGFCGSLAFAEAVMQWLESGEGKRPKARSYDDFQAIAIGDEGVFLIEDVKLRRVPILDEFYAVGSGSHYAMGAMAMGATAQEAVKIAARFDENTGGRICKRKV